MRVGMAARVSSSATGRAKRGDRARAVRLAMESTSCWAACPAAAISSEVSLPCPCPSTTPTAVMRRPPIVRWVSAQELSASGHISCPRCRRELSRTVWSSRSRP
jgi:hypothetical protein